MMRRRMRNQLGHRIDREVALLDQRRTRANTTMRHRIERAGAELGHLTARVRALSPAATLDRGYAIVMSGERIVRDAADVEIGSIVDVRVAAGSFRASRIESEGGA